MKNKRKFIAKSMLIFITDKCNLQCRYCYVSRTHTKTISIENAKKAVDFLLINSGKYKEVSMNLFGGEPLLELDLLEKLIEYAVNRAKKFGKEIHINLSTNGLLLEERALDLIEKYNIFLFLSFDGDKESHDLNRVFASGQGSFSSLLLKSEEILEKLYPNVITRITVTPETVSNFSRNIQFLINLGFKRIAYSFAWEQNWNNERISLFKKEFEKVGEIWKKHIIDEDFLWLQPLGDYIKKIEDPNVIVHLFAHPCFDERFAVTVDGEIFPCHRFAEFRLYKLGNVRDGNIDMNIYNKYLDEKDKLFSKPTGSGTCPAMNLFYNDDIINPMKNFQEFNQIHEQLGKKVYNELTEFFQSRKKEV
jgi:uncharacterized protein